MSDPPAQPAPRAPTPQAAQANQPVRDRRNPSLGDMLRSVLVLTALLSVVVLYQRFYSAGDRVYTPPVEVGPSLEQARDVAPFDVLAPVGLPAGWTPTSVRYTPGASPSWHVGYLTPAGAYAGLEQAAVPTDELLRDAVPTTSASGQVDLAGTTWQLRTDEATGETTLVRADRDATVLVTGSATQAELEQLAAALRPD